MLHGAVHEVRKCAEGIFTRRKMMEGEGLPVLKAFLHEENSSRKGDPYKFLCFEHGEGLIKRKILSRITEALKERVGKLVVLEHYEVNLVKAINT